MPLDWDLTRTKAGSLHMIMYSQDTVNIRDVITSDCVLAEWNKALELEVSFCFTNSDEIFHMAWDFRSGTGNEGLAAFCLNNLIDEELMIGGSSNAADLEADVDDLGLCSTAVEVMTCTVEDTGGATMNGRELRYFVSERSGSHLV